MRDPARIDKIVGLLRRYWHANPDLRLGQIISNLTPDNFRVEVTRDAYTDPWDTRMADPFHVEDSEWEKILDGELSKL